MVKPFTFNESEAIMVATNMLKKMKNIFKDNGGIFFYGGRIDNNIECSHNQEVIEDNESRLRKTFKNHTNWSNMRKSQKPVGNHLRFIFCRLMNTTKHNSHVVRFGNFTCNKFYIPDCISVNLEVI
jgi:predicted KAP-like P-loop ATPase